MKYTQKIPLSTNTKFDVGYAAVLFQTDKYMLQFQFMHHLNSRITFKEIFFYQNHRLTL